MEKISPPTNIYVIKGTDSITQTLSNVKVIYKPVPATDKEKVEILQEISELGKQASVDAMLACSFYVDESWYDAIEEYMEYDVEAFIEAELEEYIMFTVDTYSFEDTPLKTIRYYVFDMLGMTYEEIEKTYGSLKTDSNTYTFTTV